MAHGVSLLPQFLHGRRDVGVVFVLAAADEPLAARVVAAMFVRMAVGLVGQRGFEALEEGELAVVLGDVGQQVVGDVGQCSLLDLGDGDSRAHDLAGGGLGEGKDGSLHQRALQLAVELPNRVLVVLGDSFGAYQAASGGSHFFAKSLQMAGLASISITVCELEIAVGLHLGGRLDSCPRHCCRRRPASTGASAGWWTSRDLVIHCGRLTRPCEQAWRVGLNGRRSARNRLYVIICLRIPVSVLLACSMGEARRR